MRTLTTPSLFLGIAVAAFVLGMAAASRPMFVSSAASGALEQDLEEGCRFAVGLRIERGVDVARGTGGRSDLAASTAAVDEAVGTTSRVLDRVVTLLGPVARLNGARVTGAGRVQPVARSAFADHIDVVSATGDPGIWLPDTVVGVSSGDRIGVDLGAGPVAVQVAGVFRDLARDHDGHWCSLGTYLDEFEGRQPPPVALLDHELLLDVLAKSGIDRANVWWEYAPSGDDWTLTSAERTIAELQLAARAATNLATPLGQAVGFGPAGVDVSGTVGHAHRASANVAAAAGPVALGTAGVAVLVLLAAARTWLGRRRQEITLLTLRGAGPVSLSLKAALEMVLPMVVGGAAGAASALLLVRAVGPSDLLEAGAIRSGLFQVAAALAVALAVIAVVIGAGCRRVTVGAGAGGAPARSSLLWWEPVVLVLAAAALYELRTRGSSVVEDREVDGLLLLFPVLLLAGGAGLLSRLLLSRPTAGRVGRRLPPAGWLAVRRLHAARVRAVPIVTGMAVAVGIVVFAGTMAESLRATGTAKSLLGPGARQVIRLAGTGDVPEGVEPPGSTRVTRVSETGVAVRGHTSADVLGVEAATFSAAAFWDTSFASRSLDALLDVVDAGGRGGALPGIAVGEGIPDALVLTLPGRGRTVEVPVDVEARAEAFPGYGFRRRRPLVVVDREALARRGVVGPSEIWLDDTSSTVVDRLTEAGRPPVFVTRGAETSGAVTLEAQLWAVDYLEVIGLAAGVVTVAGLGLYFAAAAVTRRLGAATARRLGLSRARAATALGIEVTAMTAAGWVFGVGLSWGAARLVFDDLDPLPASPPSPLFRFDGDAVAVAAFAALAAGAIVAALVQRSDTRTSLPEALRRAG